MLRLPHVAQDMPQMIGATVARLLGTGAEDECAFPGAGQIILRPRAKSARRKPVDISSIHLNSLQTFLRDFERCS
jgi:CTP:molybdopterin cytidylyltransferase MocA